MTLELNDNEKEMIIAGLGKLPAEISFYLIARIMNEYSKQNAKIQEIKKDE